MIDFGKQKTDKIVHRVTKTVRKELPNTIKKLINFTNGITITNGLEADNIDNSIIGATTPAAGNFTTGDFTSQLQGALLNNQMVSKATFDILGLMTDPRFLNLQCEDPGAGTMIDVSGQGHDGTYLGSMTTGDRVMKANGWALDFDGTDDYVSLGDSNDFSFGDGANDEAVTWFGVIEIADTSGNQIILSKWDETSGSELREWKISLNLHEYLILHIYDESANVACYRYTSVGLSAGWHSFVITYDGAGGATAADTIKIYIDGVLSASTASNNAGYVAMENLASPCWIGAYESFGGTPSIYMQGDDVLTGIDGSEWSAYDVHRFHQLVKGLYGL